MKRHVHDWTAAGNCLACGASRKTGGQIALAVAAGLAIPLVAIFVGWIVTLLAQDFLQKLGAP